jgi:hypothetical protein
MSARRPEEDVMLNAFAEWVLGILKEPKRALAVSGALNIGLALVIVGGQFVHVTVDNGKWTMQPASRDLRSQIVALFEQSERRGEVRSLLQERGFYEISDIDAKDGRAVTRAIVGLGETHELVRELRELSRRNVHPFDIKERKVVVTPTRRRTVAAGEAAVCEKEDDLSQKWLLVWTDAGNGGISVKVSESVACPSTDRQLVEISPEDWAKLGVDEGHARTDAVVKVYLHQPPERIADDRAAAATQNPAPTRL